jgi:hypothetical protein
MPSTFIGYRRDDAAGYAGRLHEALERRLGREAIFRDVDTLEPGQDFVEAIEQRLDECKVFLALIGREWLDARDPSGRRRIEQSHDYVRLEITAALRRSGVRIIPVLVEGAVMPSPEALPEEIRGLARRHAVSIRDEAWDDDVDRLAAVIAKLTDRPFTATAAAGSAVSGGLVGTSAFRWLALTALLVVVAVAARMLTGARESVATDVPAGVDASTAAVPARPAPRDERPAYAVAVPRIAEVVHAKLIYSLLSASVTPIENNMSVLRLRFRFSNEGPYDVNAWDASFRLESGGQTLAPTSGLNEIVHSRSVIEGIVTFAVDSDARRVAVLIVDGDRMGTLPLDLSPTGRTIENERVGDASSLAIVQPIVREPRLLMRGDDIAATIVRGTSRRFANVVRLNFETRLASAGRFPVLSGAALLRLVAGDSVLAPIETPSFVVEPASDAITNFEFDVPPSTTRVVLRGSALNNAGELSIDVPPAP